MAMSWFKKKKTDHKRDTQPEDFEKKAEETEDLIDAEPRTNDAPAQDAFAEVNADSAAPRAKGFFSRLKNGLAKTRKILTTDIDELFAGRQKLDDELLEELEEMLITSDIGVATATELIEALSKKSDKIVNAESLKGFFKEEILNIIGSIAPAEKKPMHKPHVVMVVGVNGVGKTTTIGKLAAKQTSKGKKVLIAAADTFRAAAVEQLSIWAERAKADIVKHQDKADPAAVVYDSIEAAVSRDVDVVYIDTAGRLHTKINLMEEIKKIKRTAGKKLSDAPHEILLVLDATTGQNALSQAQLFNDALDITGLALTKLDGTAKGGIVISICRTLNIPLQYIGVGEGIDDLQDFDAEAFVEALF
jgi:fused signal recognition particle receptor